MYVMYVMSVKIHQQAKLQALRNAAKREQERIAQLRAEADRLVREEATKLSRKRAATARITALKAEVQRIASERKLQEEEEQARQAAIKAAAVRLLYFCLSFFECWFSSY